MKKNRRGSNESHFIDPDFALYERESRSNSSSVRQAERKTQQLCRQVKQALNLALADRNVCDAITDLYVDDVLPAPDCGRLAVYILVADKRVVATVAAALSRETPRLRAEIAAAITRKRVPELSFVPVCMDGGEDE